MTRRVAVVGGTGLAAAALTAAALAGVLLANAQPAVMPERRREFEPGFDLNEMLDDAGRRAQRKARKAERKARLQDLQRAALEGRP